MGSSKQFLCLSREAVGETIWYDKTTYCSSSHSNVDMVTRWKKRRKNAGFCWILRFGSTCWRFFFLLNINFSTSRYIFLWRAVSMKVYDESAISSKTISWQSHFHPTTTTTIRRDKKLPMYKAMRGESVDCHGINACWMRLRDKNHFIFFPNFFFLLLLIRKHFIMIWWDDDGW